MSQFIHIRSNKFPIQPGEEQELVNAGMYGRALAEYLQQQLSSRGHDALLVYPEDWGWWIDLRGTPFKFGACVYSHPAENGPTEFACTDGAVGRKKWSWKQFRSIDTTPWVEQLHADMLAIFQADPDVEVLGVSDEFPF